MNNHLLARKTIDYDFHRNEAKRLRAETMQNAGVMLRVWLKSAVAAASAFCCRLLERMFPEEKPRPWAR